MTKENTMPSGDSGTQYKDGGMPPVDPTEIPDGHHHKKGDMPPVDEEPVDPTEISGGHGHHHHHTDGDTPPAGMPGDHDDCPDDTGFIFATLELQSLPDFNVEEDVVILSKEIFAALESEEGEGFSIEDEFEVVMEEDSADNTVAVFVFSTDNNTLYYDANGEEDGFGDDGGAIFEFAEIVGSTEGLTVNDFFLLA